MPPGEPLPLLPPKAGWLCCCPSQTGIHRAQFSLIPLSSEGKCQAGAMAWRSLSHRPCGLESEFLSSVLGNRDSEVGNSPSIGDRRPSEVLRARPPTAMGFPNRELCAERSRVLFKQRGAWFDIRKGRCESPLLSCSAFCDFALQLNLHLFPRL